MLEHDSDLPFIIYNCGFLVDQDDQTGTQVNTGDPGLELVGELVTNCTSVQ